MTHASAFAATLSTDCPKPDFALHQDRKEKDSFFNWFYFAINLGSFLAVTTLVYIQESVSWTIGFAIPAAAMLLAVVTFVAGSSKYVHVEPTERYLAQSSFRGP